MESGNLEIIERHPEKDSGRPPLVFVHGAFTSGECWDEYYLGYFASRGYRSIAISLRGHGKSYGRDILWQFGISDYVNDVASVIESLNRKPVLVGHSMGGLVVQDYLKMHSSQAAAAVLMSSVPPEGLSRTASMMLLLYPVSSFKLNLINILPRSLWGELISEEEIRDIFFSDQTSADSVKRFLPMFQHESLRAIFEMTCCDFFMPEKIRVPVLVMGGEKDIIIPPWFVRNTASFHETPPVIIENEGHAAMLSDDWRKSADIIIDWLDELQFT